VGFGLRFSVDCVEYTRVKHVMRSGLGWGSRTEEQE